MELDNVRRENAGLMMVLWFLFLVFLSLLLLKKEKKTQTEQKNLLINLK